jgi:predicted glycoside hydrolase/deacetylase ChbG (UPF0249 family)
MLVINADDFGLSHAVNLAVVRAFEQGLCSSCSIMPNMPGFDEACDLSHTHGLVNRIGLHLTLTQGTPVTEPIKNVDVFCDSTGSFRFSRRQRVVRSSAVLRKALWEEIEGQIAKCRERGIPLTHLDSHNHAHEEWAIASLAVDAARDAGIARVRLCRTFGPGASPAKRLYRRVINARIRRAGLAGTDYFGLPDDYLLFWRRNGVVQTANTSWEVMVHPAFDDRGRLIDSWLKRPLNDAIRPLWGCAPGGCGIRNGIAGPCAVS